MPYPFSSYLKVPVNTSTIVDIAWIYDIHSTDLQSGPASLDFLKDTLLLNDNANKINLVTLGLNFSQSNEELIKQLQKVQALYHCMALNNQEYARLLQIFYNNYTNIIVCNTKCNDLNVGVRQAQSVRFNPINLYRTLIILGQYLLDPNRGYAYYSIENYPNNASLALLYRPSSLFANSESQNVRQLYENIRTIIPQLPHLRLYTVNDDGTINNLTEFRSFLNGQFGQLTTVLYPENDITLAHTTLKLLEEGGPYTSDLIIMGINEQSNWRPQFMKPNIVTLVASLTEKQSKYLFYLRQKYDVHLEQDIIYIADALEFILYMNQHKTWTLNDYLNTLAKRPFDLIDKKELNDIYEHEGINVASSYSLQDVNLNIIGTIGFAGDFFYSTAINFDVTDTSNTSVQTQGMDLSKTVDVKSIHRYIDRQYKMS